MAVALQSNFRWHQLCVFGAGDFRGGTSSLYLVAESGVCSILVLLSCQLNWPFLFLYKDESKILKFFPIFDVILTHSGV